MRYALKSDNANAVLLHNLEAATKEPSRAGGDGYAHIFPCGAYAHDPVEVGNSSPYRLCEGCFSPEIPGQRLRARALASQAIRRKLISPEPCSECGEAKSVAHHEDYSRPLKITWLCRSCHAMWHRLHRRVGLTYEPIPGPDEVIEEWNRERALSDQEQPA